MFKRISFNENVWISIKISLKFVPKCPINNIPALVQIMAWRRSGDKPLSEPMMVNFPTHICVTRLQWVNSLCYIILGTYQFHEKCSNDNSKSWVWTNTVLNYIYRFMGWCLEHFWRVPQITMDNRAQEMTGHHQAPSPSLKHCLPKSMLPYSCGSSVENYTCTFSYVQGCISVYSEETIDIRDCLSIYIVKLLSLQAPYQKKALDGTETEVSCRYIMQTAQENIVFLAILFEEEYIFRLLKKVYHSCDFG